MGFRKSLNDIAIIIISPKNCFKLQKTLKKKTFLLSKKNYVLKYFKRFKENL